MIARMPAAEEPDCGHVVQDEGEVVPDLPGRAPTVPWQVGDVGDLPHGYSWSFHIDPEIPRSILSKPVRSSLPPLDHPHRRKMPLYGQSLLVLVPRCE